MLEGVDISYANGNYQPGGESFIIINASRANVGLTVGSKYHQQVDTARAHGKEVGHYFFNGNIDPVTCANFFVDNLYDFRPGDVLVLDVEAEPGTGTRAWTPAQALAFARRVKERTGQTIGIYLNKSLMNGSDWGPVVEFGCWLWIAYYADNPPQISHWPDWTVWQYTSAGGLDRNRAKQSLAQISGGAATNQGEEDMSYSFVKDAQSATIYLCSLVTGRRVGIASPYHVTLLDRFKKGDGGMLVAELDIVHNYLAVVNPPTQIDQTAVAATITAALKDAKVAVDASTVESAVSKAFTDSTAALTKAINDDAAKRLAQ
jgi:hypothetical protein